MSETAPTIEDAPGVTGSAFGDQVVVGDYLRTRLWLHPGLFERARRGAASYRDESALWADALQRGTLYETQRLSLKDMLLMDWIPRSPGLYHSTDAAQARANALQRVVGTEGGTVILDPVGKAGMVWGGVGSLRLAMKTIDGRPTKFLCATSSGRAHRGFVVAVSAENYARVAQDLARNGAAPCDLTGELRIATPGSGIAARFATGIPRLYLDADEVTPITDRSRERPPLDVTPAVTFKPGETVALEGSLWPDLAYYTFAHFDPSQPGALEACVEWMETSYVKSRYDGQVLTDFDEQEAHFDSVACPLRTLMDLSVSARALEPSLTEAFGAGALYINSLEVRNVSNVSITGDGNVVGDNNRVVTTIHKGLAERRRQDVAEAFALLRGEIASLEDVPEKARNRSIRAIEDAEDELAGDDADPATVEASLRRVHDTLTAAGETYDATSAWAQRLRDVAMTLERFIPGAIGWLAL